MTNIIDRDDILLSPEERYSVACFAAPQQIACRGLALLLRGMAADPPVFEWYIKSYCVDINLFVDHSQIVQLECLRRGIWGTKSTVGRITSYR